MPQIGALFKYSSHVNSCCYSNGSWFPAVMRQTQNLLALTPLGSWWKPGQGWGMLAGFAEFQQLQPSLCCWLWMLALSATWQSPAPHRPLLCSRVKLAPFPNWPISSSCLNLQQWILTESLFAFIGSWFLRIEGNVLSSRVIFNCFLFFVDVAS